GSAPGRAVRWAIAMPIQLVPSFVSTLAFGIQFFIFVYLYSSHRLPFFRYLLWAWGFFTISKGLRLLGVVIPLDVGLGGAVQAAGVLAVFCVLSAALVYRWDHRMNRIEAGVGALVASGIAILGERVEAHVSMRIAVGLLLGTALIAAGAAFWP